MEFESFSEAEICFTESFSSCALFTKQRIIHGEVYEKKN